LAFQLNLSYNESSNGRGLFGDSLLLGEEGMADESNQSGGVDVNSQSTTVGRNVVGRDSIESTTTIYNYGQASAESFHNSLPNQPYFFGRKDELEKIANALDPEAQGWGVLISGPGGIGKTALAIRAGHLASDKDYPIKIFLSAKVTQLTPQGVEDLQDFMLPNYMTLLAELARELGDENIAKIDPNFRANEARRMLAEKHTLIIIDNLETFDEKTERPRVFQFLSRLPRSCKAIVTSRRRIDTPAEIIRLDRLKQEDALELIAKLATRNKHLAKATEQERLSLYETTRGNPLLIEWIAGQLGNPKSQCRTISDAIQFLGNAPKDNDPLEFVFGDLLDTFTEHETAVLAALTYFTQPAEVEWIAEIAKITTQQAETALEDLADRSVLVMEDPKYLLPPLTATFLRHARPEVIAQAGNSLSDRAFALALENGYQNFERFPILEAQWQTIAAAIPLILQGYDDRLQTMCLLLESFLQSTGRWDEQLALVLQAEEKSVAAKDLFDSGWHAYTAGIVYYHRQQSSEVLACAERAAAHWQKSGAGIRERAAVNQLHGLGYTLEKDYAAAIVACQEAVASWGTPLPENEDVAAEFDTLAMVEQLSGDYDAAERDYREALRIAKKVNYLQGVVTVTGNLAALRLDREQWAEAERMAREALLLSEGIGQKELIAVNCMHIAKACARQGRPMEGLPYAQRAVTIYTKLRSLELEKAQAVLKECEEGMMQQIDNR
jgi:tetratricopeptide (TPR) repeat protein